MRKKCSSDRETLLKFKAEGREFAKILRSLEQSIRTVKVRTIFGNRIISNELEFKLEKKYWDLETCRKT